MTAGTDTAHANFDTFLQRLWPEAQRAGISRSTFNAAFRGVTPDPEVIERAENQAEFNTPIWDYIDLRVSDARIANGKAVLSQFEREVRAIESRYGVPRNILISIWGMETNYGSHMGDKYVIRSLATLAYTGRRTRFGRQQLIAALKILQRGDVTPAVMTGSWAGAMGFTQFIPTTYNAYAVDWTGDGRRDIWRSVPDALASTGNYLRKSGWSPGLPWGWEVALPRGFNTKLAGLNRRKTIGDWAKLGVRLADGGNFKSDSPVKASLIMPAGASGPAFLVTQNFRAILRYNNSQAYALAVGHLADRIDGRGPLVSEWPRPRDSLTVRDKMELQELLNAKGYETGEIDGKLGPMTRQAVERAQRDAGLDADGEPTVHLLKLLRQDG
ncbi:lytic murein transglycosylase [Rhodoligotrophos defluvii]|uniref:lytic murein transglycosylase n=1 Tax=Rhodoligotrophos defluvii TaxID=2561934 RepID=UPI001484E04D|nr:lytic murein transglycosylase [Rhodoligotrophos defluvii]